MSRINRDLVKAGLLHLINNNKEEFVDHLSLFLSDQSGVMDYLFNPLPINSEIERKLEVCVKNGLPIPENFRSIVNIEIGFNYCNEQDYKVTYKVVQYYNKPSDSFGVLVKDDTHKIENMGILIASIHPDSIKNL